MYIQLSRFKGLFLNELDYPQMEKTEQWWNSPGMAGLPKLLQKCIVPRCPKERITTLLTTHNTPHLLQKMSIPKTFEKYHSD